MNESYLCLKVSLPDDYVLTGLSGQLDSNIPNLVLMTLRYEVLPQRRQSSTHKSGICSYP